DSTLMSTSSAAPGSSMDTGAALALPNAPGFLRRFFGRHPRLVDGFIGFLSAGLPMIAFAIMAAFNTDLWGNAAAAVVACGCFALTFLRRTRPELLAIATAAGGLIPGIDLSVTALSAWVALYSVAVYRSTRAAWISFGGMV